MNWIKEVVDLIKFDSKDKMYTSFSNYINLLVLKRIRLISTTVLIFSPLFLIYDILLIYSGANHQYTVFLMLVHGICLLVSSLYLLYYKIIIGNEKLVSYLPMVYSFLYVLIGALSSINSQRLTGNISSYIVMLLITAALLTQKPVHMIIIYGINHLIFIVGIGFMTVNQYSIITKHMNSTAMLGISILFSIYTYRLLLNDYINHFKLKQSEENFKWLFDMSPFPVFITQLEDGKVLMLSDKAKNFIGVHNEKEEIILKNLYMEKESRGRLVEELKKKGSVHNRIDKFILNGECVWIYANHELIEYGDSVCIVSGIIDITEIHKVEEELSKYATIDMLTGIFNRRVGIAKINELISCSQDDCKEFILCFIDINDLKMVNDLYGHNEGDNYIKTFCELVKSELGATDYFFRMGGDEFIIIFLDKEILEVERIWENIIAHCNDVNVNNHYKITASHGLFHYKSGMKVTIDEIIEYADKMMYKEKKQYKEITVSDNN